MTDKKITGLNEVTSLESNDILLSIDVSDQTMSTSGTNVKITKANLFTGYETSTQLNLRDTNNRNRANHTGTQPLSSIIIPDNSISESKLTNYLVSEEFTPILMSSNNNVVADYTTQHGFINRKGNEITYYFSLVWDNLTATGNMYIGATEIMQRAMSLGVKNIRYPMSISYTNHLGLASNEILVGYIQDNTDYIVLLYGTGGDCNNSVTATQLSAYGEIHGSVSYII